MCTAANDSVPAQGLDKDSVPAQGLDVTWTGLGLTVKEKVCLAPCNGTLRAGSLNALMGPTGAGKTTLLAAIARRGPVTSGDVRYNGEPWSKDLKQRVAFVDQDDVVQGTLSVRETLAYAAAFRMPASSTAAERKARVADVLSMLRLDSCADTVVGNASIVEARGVSGGERKRLCIGTELMTEPALLVCDEPTSGLDSAIALVVTESLRSLAHKRGITVTLNPNPNPNPTRTRTRTLTLTLTLTLTRWCARSTSRARRSSRRSTRCCCSTAACSSTMGRRATRPTPS